MSNRTAGPDAAGLAPSAAAGLAGSAAVDVAFASAAADETPNISITAPHTTDVTSADDDDRPAPPIVEQVTSAGPRRHCDGWVRR